MIEEFNDYGANIDVYDPWVDKDETEKEYGFRPVDKIESNKYDAIVLAVSHNEFVEMGAEAIHKLGKENHVLYDIKYILKTDEVDGRL